MYYYVYYSYEEWGRGYIGSRKSICPPEMDIEYLGSFKDTTFKPTQKIILEIFHCYNDALNAEIILHNFYDVAKNPHFANKAKQTSIAFSIEGTRHSLNTRFKLSKALKGRVLSESHRENLSIACKKRSHPLSGKPLSSGHKEKQKLTYKEIRHQQGTKNSQYGTMWITNGTKEGSYKIRRTDPIPFGYKKGRVLK
jgi:hypothetical protein